MIIIAAGSNKAFCGQSPQQIVAKALKSLAGLGQGQRISSLYDSPSWPDPAEPRYINAVCVFDHVSLEPEALMAALHATEDAFGREREYLLDPALRYAPRTLDLDLIAYDDRVEAGGQEGLVLPHPATAERDFVLAPICELQPDWRHPISGLTARSMLEALENRTAAPI